MCVYIYIYIHTYLQPAQNETSPATAIIIVIISSMTVLSTFLYTVLLKQWICTAQDTRADTSLEIDCFSNLSPTGSCSKSGNIYFNIVILHYLSQLRLAHDSGENYILVTF